MTVTFKETGFEPQNINVKQGNFVVFKTDTDTGKEFWPASDLHPTHGIYPEFDPQEPIEPTDSWKYHNHLDPFFKGIVNVE